MNTDRSLLRWTRLIGIILLTFVALWLVQAGVAVHDLHEARVRAETAVQTEIIHSCIFNGGDPDRCNAYRIAK